MSSLDRLIQLATDAGSGPNPDRFVALVLVSRIGRYIQAGSGQSAVKGLSEVAQQLTDIAGDEKSPEDLLRFLIDAMEDEGEPEAPKAYQRSRRSRRDYRVSYIDRPQKPGDAPDPVCVERNLPNDRPWTDEDFERAIQICS